MKKLILSIMMIFSYTSIFAGLSQEEFKEYFIDVAKHEIEKNLDVLKNRYDLSAINNICYYMVDLINLLGIEPFDFVNILLDVVDDFVDADEVNRFHELNSLSALNSLSNDKKSSYLKNLCFKYVTSSVSDGNNYEISIMLSKIYNLIIYGKKNKIDDEESSGYSSDEARSDEFLFDMPDMF